jgi:hypothetical protein
MMKPPRDQLNRRTVGAMESAMTIDTAPEGSGSKFASAPVKPTEMHRCIRAGFTQYRFKNGRSLGLESSS